MFFCAGATRTFVLTLSYWRTYLCFEFFALLFHTRIFQVCSWIFLMVYQNSFRIGYNCTINTCRGQTTVELDFIEIMEPFVIVAEELQELTTTVWMINISSNPEKMANQIICECINNNEKNSKWDKLRPKITTKQKKNMTLVKLCVKM